MNPGTLERTHGLLVMVSGPSGSGKTTLCRRLRDEGGALYSTSCTTRPRRKGEVDGEDYHFLQPDTFQQMAADGALLEHAEVHGNFYGTLKQPILETVSEGGMVVMDIDVQGARQVRACQEPLLQEALVDVFVTPASLDELRERLQNRATDTQEVLALRMRNAEEEIAAWPEYAYLIPSGTPEEDFTTLVAIVQAELQRSTRWSSPSLASS
ncbi:MAG: guanylate kinase [Verrucomicrobiota bacterium]